MKKEVAKRSKPLTKSKATKKPSLKTFTLRLPRFSFGEARMNVFLVLLLIAFAFILGMLTNKVIYLEKATKTPPVQQVPTNRQPAVEGAAEPPAVVNVGVGKLPVLGNKDAKVTVVEFSDFQCPFCKRYFDDAHKQILDEYIKAGKISFYYRHYPLFSIHPNAQKAAEASECANEQGKFWDYHDLLFNNQDTWSAQTGDDLSSTFTDYAGQLGIDTTQFSTCLTTGKYQQAVQNDAAEGSKAQVSGTPTFFINGTRLVGSQPFDQFKTIIDAELNK